MCLSPFLGRFSDRPLAIVEFTDLPLFSCAQRADTKNRRKP